MDSDNQHLFVMRPVEDPDLAASGQRELRAPEEVVSELEPTGLLERGHRHALGVDPPHDVPDRPILAGGIEALEDHEQRVLAFRVEPVLELSEALDVGCAPLSTLRLGDPSTIGGIAFGQAEPALGNPEAPLKVHPSL